MSAAVKLAAKTVTQQAVQATPQAAPANPIEANPVYQILFDPALSPEQQEEALASRLTWTGSKEEMATRAQELADFEKFVQSERTRMQMRLIELADPKNQALTRDTYDRMYNAATEFEDTMRPFTELLDVLQELRAQGKTFEAMEEIKSERATQEELDNEQKRLDENVRLVGERINELQAIRAAAESEKSWGGWAGPSREARERAAKASLDIDAQGEALIA